MSSKRSAVWGSLAARIAVFSGQPLEAAGYPDKAVRVIVAFAAGSFADGTTRVITQKLSHPEVVASFKGQGTDLHPGSPAEFTQ